MMQTNSKFIIKRGPRAINYSSHPFSMWCRGCRANVETVSLKEAAEITRTNTNEVITYAAQGKIHLGIRPEAVLFCLDSLLKEFFPQTGAM